MAVAKTPVKRRMDHIFEIRYICLDADTLGQVEEQGAFIYFVGGRLSELGSVVHAFRSSILLIRRGQTFLLTLSKERSYLIHS